ncbi:MAG: Sjogren's syndrome/scleroderma autoantigen 1 family protein [Candidatus Bathyarchaeia archaeon]
MGERVKRMADILRNGASMLGESCPECASPLFKLANEEIYCVQCDRKVVIVKDDEEAARLFSPNILANLENAILQKLHDTHSRVGGEADPAKLDSLMKVVNSCLDALEKIRKLKAAA